MTSDAQRAANRLNAARSTGTATPKGKARVRFNALGHGLYAQDVVLPGENRAAYGILLKRLRRDLAPKGGIEDGLVGRIADIWWRLGRAAAIEAGLLNPDWDAAPGRGRLRTGGGPLIDGFRVAIDETPTLDRLGRYEARLERALSRNLETLRRLQAAKAGRNRDKTPEKAAKTPKKTGKIPPPADSAP